jgi:hypothetical protein
VTDDIFDQPEEPAFDRWGRYLLVDPFTYTRRPWTRVTTFAKSIVDTFALNQWQQRMAVKGMSIRPDLVAMAATLDVKKDRERLNQLVDQAKDAAGHKIAANQGTAIHGFTENLDRGLISLDAVPAPQRPSIEAYEAKLKEAGISILPDMIERIICVPSYSVAGRLDRAVQEASGDRVILDVKSGSSLQYNKLEIAIQLSMYAHGVNIAGVYDQRHERWVPVPKVRTNYAIVAHIPAGSNTCELIRVNIEQGWQDASLSETVRQRRKEASKLFTPYEAPEGPQENALPEVHSVGWEARFRSVTTKQEASSLYQEAVAVMGPRSKELQHLVDLALETLGNI